MNQGKSTQRNRTLRSTGKPGQSECAHDSLEPLIIAGEILSDRDWDTLALITDEDVQQIPQTWARTVPPRYANLVSAEGNEEKP